MEVSGTSSGASIIILQVPFWLRPSGGHDCKMSWAREHRFGQKLNFVTEVVQVIVVVAGVWGQAAVHGAVDPLLLLCSRSS